jgi:hypothetical protein
MPCRVHECQGVVSRISLPSKRLRISRRLHDRIRC